MRPPEVTPPFKLLPEFDLKAIEDEVLGLEYTHRLIAGRGDGEPDEDTQDDN